MYSKGSFKEGEITNGILYDLEGQKIFEGEIRNNIPKEGKNLKLYELNGRLKYEGDFLDFLYHGEGKIYEDNKNNIIFDGIFNKGNKVKGTFFDIYYKYIGEFKNDKFNGHGQLYVLDGEYKYYLYYEGNFKDMEIFGEGIKYYKNGTKKIEGKFKNIFTYDGIYYEPHGKIIFKGEMSHKIPFDINQSSLIYNDKGNLIYNYEYYEDPVIELDYKATIKSIKDIQHKVANVILFSKGMTGKTSIINRIKNNTFHQYSLATTGLDKELFFYKFKKTTIKLTIWDTSGQETLRAFSHKYFKNSDVVIIVFDLSISDIILDKSLFDVVKRGSETNENIIYLVGIKLDITKEYIEEHRKQAKILMDSGLIDKYFEVSSKTGEGFEQFYKILRIDVANYIEYRTDKNLYYFQMEQAFHRSRFPQLKKALYKYFNY